MNHLKIRTSSVIKRDLEGIRICLEIPIVQINLYNNLNGPGIFKIYPSIASHAQLLFFLYSF